MELSYGGGTRSVCLQTPPCLGRMWDHRSHLASPGADERSAVMPRPAGEGGCDSRA